jgi:hypothetical protein
MKYIRAVIGAVTRQLISIDCEDLSSLNRLRAGSRIAISEEVIKFQFPQKVRFTFLPSE